MRSLIPLPRSTALVPLRPHALAPAKGQLDLVLDDVRREGRRRQSVTRR
jgi:hypothetical protein